MIVFTKSHPVHQAMSGASKPAVLNEPGLRRNPGEPNAEQAEENSYKKPTKQWRGLTIAVENPAGSVRRGRNRHGVTWEIRMKFDYGEILDTEGVDGDPVDVIIGPHLDDAPMVYVVHQRRVNDWAAYDEDKVMAGFMTEDDARQAFLSNYTDPRFLGPITAMPVDEFKTKVRATKDNPAMIKALLLKTHVAGYTKQDGTFVPPHEDKRQSLQDDLQRQEKWLHSQAVALGYSGIEDMLEKDYPAFERLALQWREQNPVEVAMKSMVLFFKAHVGAYLRGGKLVNLNGYQGRAAHGTPGAGQMSLFGGPTSGHPLPPSPLQGKDAVSHTPDMFSDVAPVRRVNDGIKDNGKIIHPNYYGGGLYPWQTGYDAQVSGVSVSQDGSDILNAGEIYGKKGLMLRDAIRHAEIVGDPVPPEAYKQLQSLRRDNSEAANHKSDYKAAVTSTKTGPTDDSPRRKFYVTIAREGRGVSKLAGPFDTHDEAKAHVDRAREEAYKVDPRSHWDAFGTSGVEADEHKPGVLNEQLGIKPKAAPYTPVTDDDHPAPMPRSLLSSIHEDRRAEWKDLHRQQHELHHYELGQVREKLDRLRSKRNKAQASMNEAEAGVRSLSGAPIPDPAREAEAQKVADKHRAEFDKLARDQDGLVGQHQALHEKVAKLGRAKERISAASGDMDVDWAAMRKRTTQEQQDHEKSMLKMYREHYKAAGKRKPETMTKSIVFLRSPV